MQVAGRELVYMHLAVQVLAFVSMMGRSAGVVLLQVRIASLSAVLVLVAGAGVGYM